MYYGLDWTKNPAFFLQKANSRQARITFTRNKSYVSVKPFLFAIFFVFMSAALWAQRDSLYLTPQQVTPEDLMAREIALRKSKAFAPTRSLADVDQLPFTVTVITEEDILRNGYVTLADVLRDCPAMFVSQPGNALQGETFMMRGVFGNSYVKILINDVPVKSYATTGMGIGAQLPIRQAERIEILFGAAASIYGGEACAGVINIVLKETERPLFTQADLSFGRFGYNSIDLTFGGKIGKDKKIFRFTIYGSSTVRTNNDIFYDRNVLFNTNKYLLFDQKPSFYKDNPNYIAFADSIPRDGAAAHDSRLFGVNFTWRGIHFSYHRMARLDHGGLGLNPMAATFATPQSGIREQQDAFSVGFNSRRKNRQTRFNLSANHYRIDERSSYAPVFGHLGSAMSQVFKTSDSLQNEFTNSYLYFLYYSDTRYYAADNWDLRSDIRVNMALSPKFYLDIGWNAVASFGFAPVGYFYQIYKFDPEFDGGFNGIIPQVAILGETGLNVQAEWLGPKLSANCAISVDRPLLYNWSVHPRAALLYRLRPFLALRANYASGYRAPSSGYYANSFVFQQDSLRVNLADVYADDSPFALKKEEFQTAEGGVRIYFDKLNADIVAFYEKADNVLTNGNFYSKYNDAAQATQYYVGWANGGGLTAKGIQASATLDSLPFIIKWNNGRTRFLWKNTFHFQWILGQQSDAFGHDTENYLPNQPHFSTLWQSSLIWKKIEFIFTHHKYSATQGYALFYRDAFQTRTGNYKRPGYSTTDLSGRLFLSKHFVAYFHLINALNNRGSGIDATGTPDDLIYNPQPGRSIRLGLTYNMN